MAGHSHWKQIKQKKGSNDQKRAKVFSKLLAAISVAAKKDPNPQFNPRLRTAIQKAREEQVPQLNIENAIQKAGEKDNFEELLMECYGPGGVAILIEAITDSKNRTIGEVKLIIKEKNGKWGEPGSVRWAFEQGEEGWNTKFGCDVSLEDLEKTDALIDALLDHDDVQEVYDNRNE